MTPQDQDPKDTVRWKVALSTMWAVDRDEPFASFFTRSHELGFSHQELNHRVTPAMLAAVDPSNLAVASVHEPCPCDVLRRERQQHGIHISSVDELHRGQAVEWLRGSLRLAHRLGAAAIVVHAGEVPVGKKITRALRELRLESGVSSDEFRDLQDRFFKERTGRASDHLEAVRRSLLEVASEAESLGVTLGLENRDHLYEIPLIEEMDELLRLRPGIIEYWHDTGHAEKLEELGLNSQREWLKRFSERMVGIHLHDNRELTDHIAPGLGTVDWALVARHIPRDAIRTFEIRGFTTPEQIRASQELLHEAGCIDRDG
ncbi:MAG: TIM barrel protein [Candidatus Bipolaricaulota bacterium]|nr:MAG: TIM barrel protein [Candidatus Bipolaricaulota bacterium]